MVSCSGERFLTLLHSSSSSSSSLILHPHRSSRLRLSFWAPSPSHPLLPSARAKQSSSVSTITLKQETSARDKNRNEHGNRKNEEEDVEDENEISPDESWETEIQAGLSPLILLRRGSTRKGRYRTKRIEGEEEEEEEVLEDVGKEKLSLHASTPADWAEQARKRAILSLEARNPSAAKVLERKINNEIKQKKKNKNKNKRKKGEDKGKVEKADKKVLDEGKKNERATRNGGSARKDDDYVKIDEHSDVDDVKIHEDGDDDINDIEELLKATELYDWKHTNVRALDLDSRKKTGNVEEREKIFNRKLVETMEANEVLEIVDQTKESMSFPSLLTPFNIATALHRIAKHMEASGAHESERLAFARKRSMAELVARAMEVLPMCSAQGLANIAWALSKVGGSSLYFSEMDLLAKVALSKTSEFNAQNVANMSGAYASMRHVVPELFTKLCYRASEIVETFKPQELAQVLWAHAELAQQADPLLHAIDCIFAMLEERHNTHDQSTVTPKDISVIEPFGNASAEHLSNVAWSYSALNQIKRPSFRHIWRMLENKIAQNKDENQKELSLWHLCQLYQVDLCLEYEYPQLGLSLSAPLKNIASEAWKTQKSNSSTSVYQKDVKWHLVSMGQNWVAEYGNADYSLDFALVDEKIALEFDGPSHFIRNTGSPLGHTLLKRRLLASSGWRILSIPYEEWEELDGEEEQLRYLKQLLSK